jgi:hypothetical protein
MNLSYFLAQAIFVGYALTCLFYGFASGTEKFSPCAAVYASLSVMVTNAG